MKSQPKIQIPPPPQLRWRRLLVLRYPTMSKSWTWPWAVSMLKVICVWSPTGFLAEGRKAPCKQSKHRPSPVNYFWTMKELEVCGDGRWKRPAKWQQSQPNQAVPRVGNIGVKSACVPGALWVSIGRLFHHQANFHYWHHNHWGCLSRLISSTTSVTFSQLNFSFFLSMRDSRVVMSHLDFPLISEKTEPVIPTERLEPWLEGSHHCL